MSALGRIFAGVVADFFAAWFAMLLLGVAHSQDVRVPDLGYWTTLFVLLAFSQIIAASRFVHDIS